MKMLHTRAVSLLMAGSALWFGGCTATEQGTVAGTVVGAGLGAGTGAIIGHQTGHAGAGTAIGAGIGAPVGAAVGYGVGKSIDAENEAKAARAEAQAARTQASQPAVAPPPAQAQSGIVRAEPAQKQIILVCPNCGTRNDITGFSAGDCARCPACKKQFVIP